MMVTEVILSGSHGELARAELSEEETERDDYLNLFDIAKTNTAVRELLSALSIGDTISVEHRWSERD